MTKATWNGETLAESNDCIEIEGNQYFPPNSIKNKFFKENSEHTTCPWKGEASYYDLIVDGEVNKGAAWFYPGPKDGSIAKVGKDFTGYVAFWKGVEVE
jgi:uncharacterized protein (DUF427 family)